MFLETPDGSIDLADLAPGLDLSGTVPLTWADTLQVTSVDGMNLVGEVMAPVETPHGVIYEATGETSSIPVTLYTECALRATEEAPPAWTSAWCCATSSSTRSGPSWRPTSPWSPW